VLQFDAMSKLSNWEAFAETLHMVDTGP